MKKKIIIWTFVIICIIFLVFIEFNIYKLIKNKSESDLALKKAYTIIENNEIEDKTEEISKDKSSEKSNYKNVEDLCEKTNENTIPNTIEYTKEKIVYDDENIIGILIIPKLNIEAPIKEGTTQKVMETCVGHFSESDYWDGNVSFASHNSGTSAHYFAKIHLLSENDEIVYKTKLGTRRYKVTGISKIKSTDWSMVIGNGENKEENPNTITLVTCINRKPDYRLCVRGVEI